MDLLNWKTRLAASFAALVMCIGMLGAQALLIEDYASEPAATA